MITEPCPFCYSRSISIQTPPNDSRAYGECIQCGARGPMAPYSKPGTDAAAFEWNQWARARGYRSQFS